MTASGLTGFFIRRPSFTIVLSLVLVLVGLVAGLGVPLRWVPAIHPPIVAIFTGCTGASADMVEKRITSPLEKALAGISGIETLSSTSVEGASTLIVQFHQGMSPGALLEEVRSAVQSVAGALPAEAETPVVQKADPNASPILWIAFSSDTLTPRSLSEYVRTFVMPRFQSIEGVASVPLYGNQHAVVHVWLDPLRMAARGVTVNDVSETLSTQNTEVPSGSIRGKSRYYPVITRETLKSPDAFSSLVIRNEGGERVRLGDVARTVMDEESPDTAFRVNGQTAVALAIQPQSSANPLSVASAAEKVLSELQSTLPRGMSAKVVFDSASWIRSSIHHVYWALGESVLLVLAVIWIFLGQWRAALVPLVTIPVCLVSTLALMRLTGVSLNTITLMAFVLAIGLVVDDAIVMLENIRRHMENGRSPYAAAVSGSREMLFPVIAMTLTLAAVYAPAVFVSGLTGTVFREFAVTLAGAVGVSGIVACTLSPMMCARLLRPVSGSRLSEWLAGRVSLCQRLSSLSLQWAMTFPVRFASLLLIVALAGFFCFHKLPAELTPVEDMNEMDVFVSAPKNASFSWTDERVRQLDGLCSKLPGVQTCLSETGNGGSDRAIQIISLKPRLERTLDELELIGQYQQQVQAITGVRVSVAPAMSPLNWFSEGEGSSVVMNILSPVPYTELYALSQRFLDRARQFPGFFSADTQLKWDSEQFELEINRSKAADMQVSMTDITHTLSALLAGQTRGVFEQGGNVYDITLQMNRDFLSDPDILSRLAIRNRANQMVSLGGLATLHETTAPETLTHFDGVRSDTFHAMLRPGYTIASAIQALQKTAAEILPDNARYAFQGEARNYLESGGKMIFIFGLAFVFIYLTLVAQFESFLDPLVVLLTVPFALSGAMATLWISGGSLNLYSDIALVTLIGLIAKHGILITEFANRERAAGQPPLEAAKRAVALRLRPILMTTAAMVLGALPLALATGSGAETRHQAGWVITGGLVSGTFFSLVVVPFAWVWLARYRHWLEKHPQLVNWLVLTDKEIYDEKNTL